MEAKRKELTLNDLRRVMGSAPGNLQLDRTEYNFKENIPINPDPSTRVALVPQKPQTTDEVAQYVKATGMAQQLESYPKFEDIDPKKHPPETTWLVQKPGSPELPVILPYHLTRAAVKDLADRALKRGYRQPVNFHDPRSDNTYDGWHMDNQIAQYNYPGIVGPADVDDPVQVLTQNTGLAKFEMWHRMWKLFQGLYVQESILPDIRDIMMHKDMTHRLDPLIRDEINLLRVEKKRTRIYTKEQIELIDLGITDRIEWLETMKICLTHMRTFQKLLTELPDDAMMPKKHFKNFKDDPYVPTATV
ncbi:hypothetical protein TWF694_006313 [Orbilia ellipsospora]|uniref:Uncharacterized protein n=1 Tax=Orbilia ellipsospora TaxID=2528407 RepID=A0AAV9XMB6_9PEZI